MGVFSRYHRFREAGEQANVNNVARFGEPVNSLFTSTKVFTLHHHIDITDEREQVLYQANSKFLSLHDKTDITDADGEFVAHIERKFFTLHERHFVTMEDGRSFELSNELWHIVRDVTNIEGLGWQLEGNIVGLNFELYDADGNIIAVISQKIMRPWCLSRLSASWDIRSTQSAPTRRQEKLWQLLSTISSVSRPILSCGDTTLL